MFSSKPNASLGVSVCSLEKGGCHSFGENLFSQEMKISHAAMSRSSEFDIRVFKKTSEHKTIENLCITGCQCHKSKVISTLKSTYDLTKLKNIYVVYPPHVFIENYEEELRDLQEAFISEGVKKECSIHLLSSGIREDKSHSIGLPNPLPPLSQQTKLIPGDCYGLLYIRGLELLNIDRLGDEDTPSLKLYLKTYFEKTKEAAQINNINSPTVLIISSNEKEQKLISTFAKDYGVSVQFSPTIPYREFISILQQIGKKKGVIGCNGVQTFMQALLLDCQVLEYANCQINDAFLQEVLAATPSSSKKIAQVILGLSSKVELLKDHDEVEKTYAVLRGIFIEAIEKFNNKKTASLEPPKPIEKTQKQLEEDLSSLNTKYQIAKREISRGARFELASAILLEIERVTKEIDALKEDNLKKNQFLR